jgi:formylglycine-generating enzyme required for sulfatase activity
MVKIVFMVLLLSQFFCSNLNAGDGADAAPENMVLIPGGNYIPLYGNNTIFVKVEPFFIDIYPVTNADFLYFVRRFPEWSKSRVKPVFADDNYLRHWSGDLNIGDNANKIINSPVTNISWFAAKAYCESKGKRLPTVDEWEYVAMASENNPDGTKDTDYLQRIMAWYSKPTPNVIPSIGSTFKNFYGVYDIHGLVWEWALDFNSVLLAGDSRGDKGSNRQLFCAANSVDANDLTNYAAFMRYAFRTSLQANFTVSNLGFRCVKSLEK